MAQSVHIDKWPLIKVQNLYNDGYFDRIDLWCACPPIDLCASHSPPALKYMSPCAHEPWAHIANTWPWDLQRGLLSKWVTEIESNLARHMMRARQETKIIIAAFATSFLHAMLPPMASMSPWAQWAHVLHVDSQIQVVDTWLYAPIRQNSIRVELGGGTNKY